MTNNEAIVEFILANRQQGNLVVNHRQPENGRTAVHVCVKPFEFGSFENVKILRSLNDAGFDLSAADGNNRTPLDYAMEQDSKVMAKELCRLLEARVDYSVSLRRNSMTPAASWP